MPSEGQIKRAIYVSSPNIAIIKYWGKRDGVLNLPCNSSMSLTIGSDEMQTTTKVELHIDRHNSNVEFYLNSEKVKESNMKKVKFVLQKVRTARLAMERACNLDTLSDCDVVIDSYNNFPTASGLASSASGYSALAGCLSEVFGLCDEHQCKLSVPEVARMGSGSAVRSVYGGYVVWEAGIAADGSDSISRQIFPASHWDLSIIILIVSKDRKSVPSSLGMECTTRTSELFKHRSNLAERRIGEMKKAIGERDFDTFAEITMKDSNTFHALCLDAFPPIFYLNPTSIEIITLVNTFNEIYSRVPPPEKKNKKYRAAYTFDAGPNAVLFCEKDALDDLLSVLLRKFGPSDPSRASTFITGYPGVGSLGDSLSHSEYGKHQPGKIAQIIVASVSPYGIRKSQHIVAS